MKKKNTFIMMLLFTAFSFNAKAQPGSLDPDFNPGTGVNNYVFATAIQSDGKIIVGGLFSSYNGTARNCIVRLNADGSLDAAFNPGTGANDRVNSITIQSDGKIIIGGFFTSYNGVLRNYIARLNTDGSLDVTFNPSTGANGFVITTTIQSDGKIIIGGYFTLYNGNVRNRIARLNTDGSLDTSFDPGTGADYVVYTTAIQNDGKIIIGGWFTTFNGTSASHIVRLNVNGSLDATFNVGQGFDDDIYAVVLQNDGKIIIGGKFSTYKETTCNRIVRLNTDASLDATFNSGTGANDYLITTAIQSDGKIIIGGWFTSYNSTTRNYIARLNTDGSLDASFDTGTGASKVVYATAIQSDGKIVIGGNFTEYNGISINRIARIIGGGSGINENSNKNDITIYPNPAEEIVSMNFKGYSGEIKITINNAIGGLMHTENIKAGSDNFMKTVDLANYPNGVYYIQILNNGRAIIEKIVKL